jgi:hypothetical protein
MSENCCTFAAAKVKMIKTMAQETLKSLIAVIMTLSVQEQEQVIFELQNNVRKMNHVDESVRQQLIASAEEGIAEIQRGEYHTNDEVLERMNQRMERRYAFAV